MKNSVAWIYAAAVGSYAVTMNILPGETACLACIFPESPRGTVETCETAGILNSAVNLVASIAATEALKFLVGAQGEDAAHAAFLGCAGPTNEQSWRRSIRERGAAPARETLFIWPEKDGLTSLSAAEIRCRSTSGSGRWTLPN